MNPREWFANRGQILQLAVAVISIFLAGIKAWPELRVKEFFSLGAIVLYTLVGLAVLAVTHKNNRSIKILLLCAMVAGGTWELEDTFVVKQRDSKIIEDSLAVKQRDAQIESLRKQIDDLKLRQPSQLGTAAQVIHKPTEPQITIVEWKSQFAVNNRLYW